MDSDANDELAEDSWSEASEGEQQAWLRSALMECETKPVEVDPRYEIPIEPVDFTAELSNCKAIRFNVAESPRRRNAGQPTHCSVSASMPSFNFKMLGESARGKVPEMTKLRTFPRRKSSEGQKFAKNKNSVPGFMRDTEAWSKRRSISNAMPVPRAVATSSALKRSVSNSIVSKSVCGILSQSKPPTSQSQIFFKASKPRSRSPLGVRRSLKQKHASKQPITKRSIHFPILRNPYPIEIDKDEFVIPPSHGKDSSKHWDQILTDSEQWSSCSKKEAQPRLRSGSQTRILADIASQQKPKSHSTETFDLSVSNSKPVSRLDYVNELESDCEMADDTCLIGLYNDEESFEDPFPRMASERINANLEVEQLRKALSNVSLMYQDQVQSLKRQLFSTLEQFEYDRKQIAFLKRKLAENSCPEQVRGR